MRSRWARPWYAATLVCVLAGVALSVYTASHTAGRFDTPTLRALNTFAFFTVQSNLLVGIAMVVLLVRPSASGIGFATLRLTALVSITVTGVVYHVALSSVFVLSGIDEFGNQLVHTAVPVLAVAGWLLFGPRRLTSARVAWLSLSYPLAWLVFTLVRGAFVHWYPYPFIDVTRIGYAGALVNCLWVAALFLGLAGVATRLDRALGTSAGTGAPTPPTSLDTTPADLRRAASPRVP